MVTAEYVKRGMAVKLRPATLRGVERRETLKDVKITGGNYPDGSERTAWLHGIYPTCKVYRVGEDAVVISDGAGGYTPFSLSALKEIIWAAAELPVVKEVSLP